MCVYIYVYICVCIYIYISQRQPWYFVRMHTPTHTHTHTHTHSGQHLSLSPRWLLLSVRTEHQCSKPYGTHPSLPESHVLGMYLVCLIIVLSSSDSPGLCFQLCCRGGWEMSKITSVDSLQPLYPLLFLFQPFLEGAPGKCKLRSPAGQRLAPTIKTRVWEESCRKVLKRRN